MSGSVLGTKVTLVNKERGGSCPHGVVRKTVVINTHQCKTADMTKAMKKKSRLS